MQFFIDIRVRMIHSRPISDTMNRVPTIFSYWNSRTFPGLSRTLMLHFMDQLSAVVYTQHNI